MSYFEVSPSFKIRCIKNLEKSSKKYTYEYTVDGVEYRETSNSSPLDLNSSSKTDIFKILQKEVESTLPIKKEVMMNGVSLMKDKTQKELDIDASLKMTEIKNWLENNLVDEYEEEQKKNRNGLTQQEEEANIKYDNLYSKFKAWCEEDDLSFFEEVIAITHCLGVGNPREIIKAWIGYFQTYLGYKGTNVIAVGSPATGKSFVLETALSMIPEEKVHKGVKSVAYFFRKYNHQDLTGHIFYLQDLGGEKDNEETIALRDLLKQLSTDGYVERGIVDSDDGMSEEDQWVKGYPCLTYSTANESIINDQEKSRSIILTPAIPDYEKISIFKSVVDNKGDFEDDFRLIDEKRESIKGLVHHFLDVEYNFFNPYLFDVADFIKGNDDFNRKIDEYNAILKLVTILNYPFKLKYERSIINEYEEEDVDVSDLVLASKRDNINALNIFSSSNFLPDEILFANGVIDHYSVIDDVEIYERVRDGFIEPAAYEDYVGKELFDGETDSIELSDTDLDGRGFTLQSLKRRFKNSRWFSKSKEYVRERIKLLYDEGIIIRLGSTRRRESVYALNYGVTGHIDDVLPEFTEENLEKSRKLFSKNFNQNYDEFVKFIDEDESSESNIFETVEPTVLGLPFNKL